jgi:alkylation response protein AidB-like acyl-CoA dehydrogenase
MSNIVETKMRDAPWLGPEAPLGNREGGRDCHVCRTSAEKRLLLEIADMAPAISRRAGEMEAQRCIPRDLVDTLQSVGVFRLFVPRSHGGLELDLPAGIRIIEALARIDGSVGWTAMIGSTIHIIAGLLPRETYERIYGNGPDVLFAGSSQPVGTAEAADDGWRVKGRWPFASGCLHADWMIAMCVMTRNGKPLLGDDGKPLLRGFAMPASAWQIEDTWHVAGLEATGSHHIAFADKLVPAGHFFDFLNGASCLRGPLYQTAREVLPVMHGAFAVGVARGALDELLAFAGTGRQQLHAPVAMRDSEIFQGELGRIEAELRAAEALHRAQAASHWRHALAGTLRDEARFLEATQAGIWISAACVRVVDACFELAGGSAAYDSSPLQRRLRDMRVGAQHAAVHRRHYLGAGKRLLASASPSPVH